MADFNPINTEEEFDTAVRERYGDVAGMQRQIDTLTGERDGHAETIKTLQGELNSYKTAELKSRIAKEMGIPEYMAGRLSGADEKALRADAQTLKASLNTFKGPAPGKKDNDGSKDGGSGLLGMLRGMKGA